MTIASTELEVALPGFGFVTVTRNVPADAVVPEALSWFVDTNVVASAVAPSETFAPLTNLLPVIEREKEPVRKLMGAILLSNGTGFSRLTVLDPIAFKLAALTARTVTVVELGKLEGA